MRSLSLLVLFLLTGCSTSYELNVPDGAIPGDGSRDVGATCPPPITPEVPGACAPLLELSSPQNAVTLRPGGGAAFALTGLVPAPRADRASCEAGYWEDFADVRARFTAPAGGRWRFTAAGGGVISLLLSPCDETTSCTGDLGIRGEGLSSSIVRELEMQRGDSLAVILDGCPAGVSCSYDLSVERLADLSCPVDFASSVCAADAYCAIDACDAERFACRPLAPPVLTSIAVYADDTSGYVVATADDGGAGRGSYLLVRWYDASGALITTHDGFVGGEIPTDGSELVELGVPAGAVRGTFWLYTTSDPEGMHGRDVTVTRWSGHGAGQRCSSSPFTERCADGLRCDESSCVTVSTVEITSATAFYDAQTESLRVRLEGFSPTTLVSEASIEMLDALGASLGTISGISIVSTYTDASRAAFRVSFVVSNLVGTGNTASEPFRIPSDVAQLDVIATDAQARHSAPFRVGVRATSIGGIGAACGDLDRGCAAGLECPVADSYQPTPRCRPPLAPSACDAPNGVLVWSPPGEGTHAFRGVFGSDLGGFTECLSGRVITSALLELVAPSTGTYGLDLSGGLAIQLSHDCTNAMPTRACARAAASGAAHLDVSLVAGEHVLVTVLGAGPGAFDLQLVAP